MNWLRQLLRRGELDRDLAEEIRQHLEEQVEELVASGMPREEALRAARRAFGNAALIEERGREVWRWTAVESFLADLRHAARQLRRSPSFTLASILTVALGIGANTAVFSVVDAVILRPLDFPAADRLVSVESCSYFPYRQLPWFPPSMIVRTSLPPLAVEPSVRQVVASLDKEVPVHAVLTVEQARFAGFAIPRFLTILLGSFAAIALLLAAVGLYGVLAYSVLRRTREIGVRMALRATRAAILAMVLRRAMVLVTLGLSIGLAGAFAGHRLLTTMIYGAAAPLPLLLAGACVVMALSAALASYLPARRAASVEPVEALRMD